MLGPNLLRLSGPILLPQHENVVNIPISFACAKTMESDLVSLVDIHRETVFGVGVERAWGTVTIFFKCLKRISSNGST